MSLFDEKHCQKYNNERIEIPSKEKEKINHCENCNSTSMEMCLLIRHCEYWVNPYESHEYQVK